VFLGLLEGCFTAEDGSFVMRMYPSEDCDDVDYRQRILTGSAGLLILCAGVPAVCAVLALQYERRKFSSSLSYFLVRSIFAGDKDSLAGFGYRIFKMIRTFGFVATALSPKGGQSAEAIQCVSFLALIVLTLFVESVIKPHTTGFVGIMESLGELCICAIVGFGYLASGEEQCVARFRPLRGTALTGHCLHHAVREDRSGSLSVYTVGIFVSLAAYIMPMALLVLTRAATRVQLNAGRI
jgi:hypothetical protein